MHYDVFNGDADGICSLVQLRLETPRDATLVSGTKRDVKLLERVLAASGDTVTVLDVSLATNRDALATLLDRGIEVEYFDHHYAGALPRHPGLRAHIDTLPEVCTGILVDRHLGGRRRLWAVAAAYGDDLRIPARDLARSRGLSAIQRAALRLLGEALTYNAYGEQEADLVLHPVELYRELLRCGDPLVFVRTASAVRRIVSIAADDLEHARAQRPVRTWSGGAAYVLPDAPWSRRVRGLFANHLARRYPMRAHALVTPDDRGGYAVSVRAPRLRPHGADDLCRRFATGGGRTAAAGINHLPLSELEHFLVAMAESFDARRLPP